jgi:hypothetical protein
MPRTLLNRWRPECIVEFRASALQRFDDGIKLAAAGRRTGAVYLWGYCAEMLLKAAYFSANGFAETDPISWAKDIYPAIERGRKVFHIAWPHPGQGHNIRAWSELLIAERVFLGIAFVPPLDTNLQRYGHRIGRLWSESLRYHKNVAYLHEMRQVREAVEWLLVNSDVL